MRVWVILHCLLFAGVTIALGSSDLPAADERVWHEFIEWFAAQPPKSDPRELIGAYRNELIKRGTHAQEADQKMSLVWKQVFRRPEGVKLLWNKVYAGDKPIFSEQPTALLVQAVQSRSPAAALDVGMGQGRNSLFLALAGWKVTGFDPSDEGLRQAQAKAKGLGVEIETINVGDDQFDFGHNRWDLIVMTYVHTPSPADADRFWDALKPGGIVVYENGADPDNRVLKAFERFRILHSEDVMELGDWNPGQKTRIQRLIAEKSSP
jgi:2-polyprenyl-3-methyl-5-hydroxy-6-metoxy-1,4-benzoquinol methylase